MKRMAEKEYIERAKVMDALIVNTSIVGRSKLKEAVNAICAIPAADVRPVVRGRWEYNPGDNIPYCSECMMPQDSECNFCPNCGADMREES
jgi:hypothetical protein